MIERIRECMINEEWVCIYEGNEHESFIFGMIVDMDDQYYTIHRFTPNGEDDGLLMMDIESVFRIEIDTKYIQKMRKLIDTDGICGFHFVKAPDASEGSSCSMRLLELAVKEDRVVGIELSQSEITDIFGRIQCIGENTLTVRQINDYGEADGLTVCFLDDITELSIGSESDKIREKLTR